MALSSILETTSDLCEILKGGAVERADEATVTLIIRRVP